MPLQYRICLWFCSMTITCETSFHVKFESFFIHRFNIGRLKSKTKKNIVASCLPGMLYGFRISDSTYNKTLVSKVRSDLDFPASTKPEILCRVHDELLTQTPRTFQGKLPSNYHTKVHQVWSPKPLWVIEWPFKSDFRGFFQRFCNGLVILRLLDLHIELANWPWEWRLLGGKGR